MSRSRVLWGLAFLNAVLAMVLVWKLGGENVAQAQRPVRSEYAMVPADIPGAANGVIYVIDTSNGLLGAFFYDNNRKALDVMPPIDLVRLFGAPPGVGAPR